MSEWFRDILVHLVPWAEENLKQGSDGVGEGIACGQWRGCCVGMLCGDDVGMLWGCYVGMLCGDITWG